MPDDSNHNKVPTDIHSNACDLPISIRPLDVNDTTELHAVVTLVNKAYRTHTNWTNEADIVTGDRVTFASLREQCTKWHHLIAEHTLQNIIVGVIQVGNTDHTIAGTLHEPCGYFGMLAVHGQFQSCGIGSRLINSAELFCKEKGMRSMIITVLDVRNDIIKWYSRKGYTFTGQKVHAEVVLAEMDEKLLKDSYFANMRKEIA